MSSSGSSNTLRSGATSRICSRDEGLLMTKISATGLPWASLGSRSKAIFIYETKGFQGRICTRVERLRRGRIASTNYRRSQNVTIKRPGCSKVNDNDILEEGEVGQLRDEVQQFFLENKKRITIILDKQ